MTTDFQTPLCYFGLAGHTRSLLHSCIIRSGDSQNVKLGNATITTTATITRDGEQSEVESIGFDLLNSVLLVLFF